MINSKRYSLAALVVLAIAARPVAAHHGTAVSYDASHPITMKAVVTEFHYANPHPQLYFDVTDEKGSVVHWGGEVLSESIAVNSTGLGQEAFRSRTASGCPHYDYGRTVTSGNTSGRYS